jgi:hypothetical protein
MPYKSTAQAAYMHIHHPTIARRWDKEGGKVQVGTKAKPGAAKHAALKKRAKSK